MHGFVGLVQENNKLVEQSFCGLLQLLELQLSRNKFYF